MSMIDVRDIPVHYINLDTETGKDKITYNLLSRMGFKNINRFSAIVHEDPKIGCARSHYTILHENTGPLIIVEDDIVSMDTNRYSFDVPKNADALYLGCSQWGRYLNFSGPFTQYKRISPDIVRIYNMLSGHAMCVLSDDYRVHLSRIARHAGFEHGYHMDVGYAETQKFYNVLCLEAPMFAQRGYNYKVTSGNMTEMCSNVSTAKPEFDVVKYNLTMLDGVRDLNGVCSFYDPRWWD